MRAFVQQLLDAARATLELAGPVALIADDSNGRDVAPWMRRHFAGQLVLDCRVPSGRRDDDELDLGDLPVENESLRTLLCLDLLHRFEETAALLRLALPLLAPGGMALVTANIGNARPREGLSRVLTPVGLEKLVAELDAAILGWQGDPDFPNSLFLVACRSPVPSRFANQAGRFIDTFQTSQRSVVIDDDWPARLRQWLRRWFSRREASAEEASAAPTSFLLHLPGATDWREALLSWPPAQDVASRG
ncbi:MAG TPA: hypothetical protein VHD36_15865 [Pirellulales bacterium]|nr:hypothetical protein [Pirellulales bacterium]